MDEPLSNLYAKLRMEMRSGSKRLHMETDSTFVYVTHDQLEAMTLVTKISLMKKGVLQQYAQPLTIYKEPANAFVADFIGNPNINLVPTTVESVFGNSLILKTGKYQISFMAGKVVDVKAGDKLKLGIRPEHVTIDPNGQIEAKVYSTLPSDMDTVVKLDINGTLLTSVVFGDVDFAK